jgi:dihydrofolate reductase
MPLSLVCAASSNDVIGAKNRLPWRLPADLIRFKQLTLRHSILMGRKTYESIGRPLPERTNIVISHQAQFQAPGCQTADSLEKGLGLCDETEEIFVIGGANIYQQTLPLAQKIYLTRIHQTFEGDTYLFPIPKGVWRQTQREDFQPDEKNLYPYSFLTYQRL